MSKGSRPPFKPISVMRGQQQSVTSPPSDHSSSPSSPSTRVTVASAQHSVADGHTDPTKVNAGHQYNTEEDYADFFQHEQPSDLRTRQTVPRVNSGFWGNPGRLFVLSPIAEEPESPDTSVRGKLHQSLENLNTTLTKHKLESSSPSTSLSSSDESGGGKQATLGRPAFTLPSSPETLSDLEFSPVKGKDTNSKRTGVNNGSKLVLSHSGPFRSTKGRGRPRGRRGKTTRGLAKQKSSFQFYRYIYRLFQSTLASQQQKQSRQSRKSRGPKSKAPKKGSSSLGTDGSQSRAPKSGTKSGKSKAGAAREVSKLSSSSMEVLNAIVKDLIVRFANETNQLLGDSKVVQLRESQALAAAELMLAHNIELGVQLLQQYRRLADEQKLFKPNRGKRRNTGRRARKAKQPQSLPNTNVGSQSGSSESSTTSH